MNSTSFIETVERAFATLAPAAGAPGVSDADAGPGLGGKLLYAGELDQTGRALVVAANIGGAATLAASGDPVAQRQAVRDGVVDFLVTSLDEALRILKNEIRKGATVAVCVAASPASVEREMTERGVLPDLVFAGWKGETRNPGEFGGNPKCIQLEAADKTEAFLQWQVEEAPARWMPKLDAIAHGFMNENLWTARWLRLAARYCGRAAQGIRVLHCDSETAKRIIDGISGAVKRGEIAVPVRTRTVIDGQTVVAVASPNAERPDKN
jgi:urocanate hydratase